MAGMLMDTVIVAERNLRRSVRVPEVLFFALLQPVMFVVLFRYVFGGAIDTGSTSYVNFLMAGIFVQTAAFTAYGTGISLVDDMQRGLLDRFRSLPMRSFAVVTGRIITDIAVSLVALGVMIAVGIAVGFRPQGGADNLLEAIGMLVIFGFAFCWIGAVIGLSMRSVQAVQTGGFIWLFPLTFVSSAFVPVGTMPGWLRGFANNQPFTRMVNAIRTLVLNEPSWHQVLWALIWCAGIVAVFVPLAVRAFRRASLR